HGRASGARVSAHQGRPVFPAHDWTVPARLQDMVPGRSTAAFEARSGARLATWKGRIEGVAKDCSPASGPLQPHGVAGAFARDRGAATVIPPRPQRTQ